MSSINAIEKLIKVARAEIGYMEKATNSNLDDKTANAGHNDFNKYARDLDQTDLYNGKKNGYWWCDIFVDWCFVQAFGFDKARALTYQPLKSAGAGCTYSAQYYKNNGRFFKSNPQPGDQIFFSKDGGKTSYHTGIVEKVEGGKVYTIEGNTTSSKDVVPNGGSVRNKAYSLSYSQIGGYGRPDYSIVSDDDIKSTNKVITSTTSVSTPSVKTGVVSGAAAVNVRTGPGVTHNKIKSLVNGTKIDILGSNGDKSWYKIKSGTCEGWMRSTYITINTTIKKTTTGSLYLRSDRNKDSKALAVMPKGTVIEVSDLKNGWYKAKYKNMEGYCSANYLE